MFKRCKLVRDLINHLFWTRSTDYKTEAFETDENIEIVNRAIDIARQQLPRRLINDDRAVYTRCVRLFNLNAYYFYKNWC